MILRLPFAVERPSQGDETPFHRHIAWTVLPSTTTAHMRPLKMLAVPFAVENPTSTAVPLTVGDSTLAAIALALENPDSPAWLPTPKEIVIKCKEHGEGPSNFSIYAPDGSDAAFIKYGPMVAMAEARTQKYIADIVNSDEKTVVLVPRVYYAFRSGRDGYTVMEHVGDEDSTEDDCDTVADAVQRLRSIPSPTTSPGPVGGGILVHRFFSDHLCDVQYNSVKDLQQHINNILAISEFPYRVDFSKEDDGQLRLCLDDIHPRNFRKDKNGRIFAVDFGKTSFLPFAFQDLAYMDGSGFAERVGERLNHPGSQYTGILRIASGRLYLFNNSSHGLPKSLRESIGSYDLFA
ncbi:hypothetical protein FRC17_002032 [Serendipita sp. 399]|nr:hypothetical protein FRC17_002032 [Serendipita sp. 399]